MEVIRNLVQSLIIIIILAMFLEMLLPAGEMRKYVKMVMGLLVIIAVVQAVGTFARWSFEGELPAVVTNEGKGQLPEILEAGKKISAEQQDRGIEQYRRGLAQQITALVKLNQEIPVLDVEVSVQSDNGSSGFGQIKEIILAVAEDPAQADREPEGTVVVGEVSPVSVQVGRRVSPELTSTGSPQAVANMVDVLTNFYNLKPEQVKIIYR